jgi:uncharacterized iron-regulated membrane protein
MAGIWPRFRAVLFWVHLGLGLSVALPVFVMCVTGAVLAYKIQIETWIDLWGVKSIASSPGAQALTIESLIETIHKNQGMDPQSITIYRDPAKPVEVDFGTHGPLYLDAYSGRIIGGHSRKTHQFFEKVLAWHVVLGVSGPHSSQFRVLAGGANGAALLLVILGISLWVPRRWSWPHLRAVTLLRWGAPGRARDFNWHNAIGIWSAVPLLAIVGTGIAMSYAWASRTYGSTGPSNTARRSADELVSEPRTAAKFSGLDVLVSRAKQQAAGWKAITLYLPHGDSDPVHFAIGMKDYIGYNTMGGLALERTGTVVYFTPAGIGALSPTTFIRYGHTGEAWGVAGQTVAAVASLGGTIVVWTGLALCFRRWRSWQARRTKLVA